MTPFSDLRHGLLAQFRPHFAPNGVAESCGSLAVGFPLRFVRHHPRGGRIHAGLERVGGSEVLDAEDPQMCPVGRRAGRRQNRAELLEYAVPPRVLIDRNGHTSDVVVIGIKAARLGAPVGRVERVWLRSGLLSPQRVADGAGEQEGGRHNKSCCRHLVILEAWPDVSSFNTDRGLDQVEGGSITTRSDHLVSDFTQALMMSIGSGKTTVVFFSTPISVSV